MHGNHLRVLLNYRSHRKQIPVSACDEVHRHVLTMWRGSWGPADVVMEENQRSVRVAK